MNIVQELADLLRESGAVLRVGLRQQGHLPTVERMLAEGADWPAINAAIGWSGDAARRCYDVERREAGDAAVADSLTAVIHQLRKHQRSHQSWLDHYLVDPNHTCGRCTPEVLAGVGDAIEQEISVKVYDGLIARVTEAQSRLREGRAQ